MHTYTHIDNMNKERFGPHLKIILDKMCSFADITLDDIDWDDKEWFLKYTWSEQDSNEFEVWLFNYFKNNREARIEILDSQLHSLINTPHSRNNLKKACIWFVFNYGWRYQLDE